MEIVNPRHYPDKIMFKPPINQGAYHRITKWLVRDDDVKNRDFQEKLFLALWLEIS